MRDKILLSIALSESIFILLYHIFFVHYIFLYVIRVIKVLEQLTIFFILIEISTKVINSVKSFWVCLSFCFLSIAAVIVVIIIDGNYSFLYERNLIWIIISLIQCTVALVTFLVGICLMRKNPEWNASDVEQNLKKRLSNQNISMMKAGQRFLDVSAESYIDTQRKS